MSTHRLFSLIVCLCFITSFLNIAADVKEPKSIADSFKEERTEDTQATTNLRSWRGQSLSNLYRQHRHLKAAQGVLSIIGWGTLLPTGAIIARNFRQFPTHWKEWLACHVICQTSGYFLGTIGWFAGLLASRASNKPSDDKTHRILGIIIFTFTTIQMFAIFWQPKKEERDHSWRKSWEIYHHLLGYVLIALIIADIFQGVKHQNQATKWRWTYIGIVGFLGLVAVSLEIFRRVKSKLIHNTIELNSNMYTST